MVGPVAYEPRYLAGLVLFNRRDYFDAHEVWESLWMDTSSDEKRFYQALIQAAVALYHFGNGNLRGAYKLYHSSRAYMERYDPVYLGLDRVAYWQAMERCFAELLVPEPPVRGIQLKEELIPTISIEPAPESWPDPEQFLEEE